jgi:hypothetical protein
MCSNNCGPKGSTPIPVYLFIYLFTYLFIYCDLLKYAVSIPILYGSDNGVQHLNAQTSWIFSVTYIEVKFTMTCGQEWSLSSGLLPHKHLSLNDDYAHCN